MRTDHSEGELPELPRRKSRWRLMDERDEAGREVARLQEELIAAQARHRRLCQEAYDAGDRG